MVSPDRNRRVEEAGENRRLLIYHPAGVFFALAAAIAVTLPWLWFLPLEDPWLAHVRLGLFGFGGIAISGYIMTAQKAWTGRAFPVPALLAGGLALGGRLASLGFPAHLWPIILFSLPVAIMVAWPVLRWLRPEQFQRPDSFSTIPDRRTFGIPHRLMAFAMGRFSLSGITRAVPSHRSLPLPGSRLAARRAAPTSISSFTLPQ